MCLVNFAYTAENKFIIYSTEIEAFQSSDISAVFENGIEKKVFLLKNGDMEYNLDVTDLDAFGIFVKESLRKSSGSYAFKQAAKAFQKRKMFVTI